MVGLLYTCLIILTADYNKLAPGDVAVLMVDALQYDTHRDAAANAVKFFGHVDMVVLNSGRSQRAWIVDTELAVDKALWEWNLLGSVSLAKAILPHMIGRKEGHIVVTSSIAGKIGVLCMLEAKF
jgi:NADP-dependent 3-hydroxy acid dehydrogenase YdfG